MEEGGAENGEKAQNTGKKRRKGGEKRRKSAEKRKKVAGQKPTKLQKTPKKSCRRSRSLIVSFSFLRAKKVTDSIQLLYEQVQEGVLGNSR